MWKWEIWLRHCHQKSERVWSNTPWNIWNIFFFYSENAFSDTQVHTSAHKSHCFWSLFCRHFYISFFFFWSVCSRSQFTATVWNWVIIPFEPCRVCIKSPLSATDHRDPTGVSVWFSSLFYSCVILHYLICILCVQLVWLGIKVLIFPLNPKGQRELKKSK